MLTIGEFSRICFVTKKTLRHYDEIGLLRPQYTAENGYRYYTVEQLRTMRLISRLKHYGFSLPEIASTLANPDEDFLAEKLIEKRGQLEAQLQNTNRILAQLDEDVDKLQRRIDIMEQNIAVKTVQREDVTIFGLRQRINVKNFSELIGEFFATVTQKKITPAGPLMTIYYEPEFNPDNCDTEIAIPVAGGTEGAKELCGGLHCCTTLLGPYGHEPFTAAYSGLMKWVEENGYRVSGAPFEVYVRGGNDCPPEDYVTEIYFPIAKA